MTIEQLLKAIASGAPLLVRPRGENSPSSAQELQPLTVRDGEMQARCLASGHTETFRIENIEFLTEAVFTGATIGNECHATTRH